MAELSAAGKNIEKKQNRRNMFVFSISHSDGTISFRDRFEQFKSIDDSIVGKNRNQFDRFAFWVNIDRRNR